ncbi:MAG: hypothetical protein NTZ01_00295 [Verrucomicrobia bacterium]|nr:hypothetical protein [Verrucomicrobiota bacterium]
MSVFIIRAFVQLREKAQIHELFLRKVAEIDQTLLNHDSQLKTLWDQIMPLLTQEPEKEKPSIGFSAS